MKRPYLVPPGSMTPDPDAFTSAISPIEDIIEDARNGRPYILVDAEDRENEGDVIIPAQFATPEAITVPLGRSKEVRMYTVRLYFAEPELVGPGRRRFHIDVQGDRKAADFDIVRAAGNVRRGIIQEYRGVPVTEPPGKAA